MDEKANKARNPDFEAGKKIILYVLCVVIGFRVFSLVLQLIYLLIGNALWNMATLVSMIGVPIGTLLFAAMIYTGSKGFVYIALFGGIFSIFQTMQGQVLFNFTTFDTFFNVSNIVFHLAIFVHIIAMIYLMIDKKCDVYFQEMKNIQTD